MALCISKQVYLALCEAAKLLIQMTGKLGQEHEADETGHGF